MTEPAHVPVIYRTPDEIAEALATPAVSAGVAVYQSLTPDNRAALDAWLKEHGDQQ